MNITDLIGEDYNLTKVSYNVFSTKEHDSLKIWTDTNSWFWFSKGFGGNVIDWLTKIKEYDIETAKVIAQDYGVIAKQEYLPIYYDPNLIYGKKRYHPYLKERNITKETANHFELEVNNQLDKIIIPINEFGVRSGAIIRKINAIDKQDRYKLILRAGKPALWPIKTITKPIILFEGCWSVMRWWQNNSDDFDYFAILGAFPSKKLKEIFNDLQINVVMDCDNPQLREHLEKLNIKGKYILPNIYPDEMSDAQIKNILKKISK